MKRIAVVDNEKLRDMQLKKHIQGLCPVNRSGRECIKIDEQGNLLIDEVTCIGCGICTKAAPDAIKIINLPEVLDKDPLFRYGKNGFALYNLPIPLFGKVVGIIGRNGIGKSTALKLLANVLKPNFGKEGYQASEKEVIDYFKGTEAQIYFERLYNGELRLSYKPQQVDLIPKQYQGTVKALLAKVDEKDQLEEVAQQLDLLHLLDRDIAHLSGGELQRVAIAATVLKDAHVYIFDEPTSYLDIKQRLKVTKFIRSLVNDQTAVLLVEHDLIILDYLTDMVHITYGQENVYGVVSQPKAARAGINAYLSGYLREENIRFREKTITFAKRPPFIKKEKPLLTGWKNIKKQLGNFILEAPEGALHQSDVVGVVGENGIGKTSFVKLLADIEKPDEGMIFTEVKVSYKPQYLEPSDELVVTVLQEAMKTAKPFIDALQLEKLFYQPLSSLSGGQLQRVAIAACVGKEADLYLLDEPSAYLDIEQRLLVAKLLRDFAEQTGKTMLIVDHDLVFIDYLSDKLLVFDGQPGIHGIVLGPYVLEEGMNTFLADLAITFRRDEETHRPRANKPGSQKDKQQQQEKRYYY